MRGARAGEGRQLTALDEGEHRATDRSFLQQDAYADSSKLRARASIYQYRDPPGAIGPWVIGLVEWRTGQRALDVGCGPGTYLALLRELQPDVRAVGADVSPGMAREALEHAPVVAGDIASLPFPSSSFDTVLAPHMLYHCPDIDAALRDVRRVLADGGTFVAVTNDVDHLAELWDVHHAVVGERPPLVADRFNLETGRRYVETAFESVRMEPFFGTVAVPDADMLVSYLASMQHFAGVTDDDTLAAIRARIQSVIDREGAFTIGTRSGAFVCR